MQVVFNLIIHQFNVQEMSIFPNSLFIWFIQYLNRCSNNKFALERVKHQFLIYIDISEPKDTYFFQILVMHNFINHENNSILFLHRHVRLDFLKWKYSSH